MSNAHCWPETLAFRVTYIRARLGMENLPIVLIAYLTVFIIAADGQNKNELGKHLKLGLPGQGDLGQDLQLGLPGQDESTNPNDNIQNLEPPNVTDMEVARASGKKRQADLGSEDREELERKIERYKNQMKAFEENQQRENLIREELIREKVALKRQFEDKLLWAGRDRLRKEEQIRNDATHSQEWKENAIRQIKEQFHKVLATLQTYHKDRERVIEERIRQSYKQREKNNMEEQRQWQSGEGSSGTGLNRNQMDPTQTFIPVPLPLFPSSTSSTDPSSSDFYSGPFAQQIPQQTQEPEEAPSTLLSLAQVAHGSSSEWSGVQNDPFPFPPKKRSLL